MISDKEAGIKLARYLEKQMPAAPKGFFYKMLRKKNIVLNGKKAEGIERLKSGDEVTLFLSEETIEKFQGTEGERAGDSDLGQGMPDYEKIAPDFSVVYEDSHILIVNKPAGLLSQKAKKEDISLVEHIYAYLLRKQEITGEELKTFHPGICNRLDRNTSGLVIAGKTLGGLQEMNALLKERAIDKYYLTLVSGKMEHKFRAEGYLKKDRSHNRASISSVPLEGADYICTEYEPEAYGNGMTLVRAKLITGKSHQIRAQLQSLGYPVLGDGKYGDGKVNKNMRRFSVSHHLLHAYEIRFPALTGNLAGLSEKTVNAPLPKEFESIVKKFFPEARIG